MLKFFLGFLAMLPGTYLCNWLVSLVVPVKKPWLFALLTTLGSSVLWLSNQLLLPQPSVLMELGTILVSLLCLMFFTEQRLRGILVDAVLQMTCAMGAIVTIYIMVYFLKLNIEQMNPGSTMFILCCAMASCISVLLASGAALLMRKLLTAGELDGRYLCFLTVPLSQAILLNLAARPVLGLSGYSNFTVSVLLCVVLCIAADGACVHVYRKLRQMENLKLCVVRAEKALDGQIAYYEQLQEQILSINRVRHDLNNQLQAARYLLEQGDTRQVSEQLELLEDSVRDRVGPRYCENLVADAVLSMKARECSREGITLDASILLPLNLPIRNAHLCSIFSNLLDNSIQGIRETGQPGGTICIRSDLKKNYLVVTCSNPAVPPRKKASSDVLRQHGLGLDILEYLARMYRGSLDTAYEDGRFTVTLCIGTPVQTEKTAP